MKTILPVENKDALATLQNFFKTLFTEGLVDVLLVPMRTPYQTVTPALVSDPVLLEHADPLAPLLAVNSATLLGQLSARQPRPRVGAVVRSCEARALIELIKMQQADLADLLLISMDCAGTYNVPTFLRKEAESGETPQRLWKSLYRSVIDQPDQINPELRAACQICEQPVYEKASINIELFNSDLEQAIHLTIPEEMGKTLGLQESPNGKRDAIVDRLIRERQKNRDQNFADMRKIMESSEGLAGVFASCIRCHNCMTVCPICYCKTCAFKSAVFEHAPLQFVEWSKQKGAYRLPADTMLFHLTRMNHMVLSCVGCGMCTEACPAELPVGTVFRAVGERVQKTFDYLPGRDVEEALPLVTFKADEWSEVGE